MASTQLIAATGDLLHLQSGETLVKTDTFINSKLKNNMAIFTCLTQEQAELLKVRNIEPWKLKSPLIFMTVGAGLLGSVSLSFVKGLTESFRIDGWSGYLLYVYVVIAILLGVIQLKILNKSMELYD